MKLLITALLLIFNSLNISGKADSVKHAVRGVWLTNVDSKALNSSENIADAVNICSELGINTIFVVTWNKAMTTYPSKIMKEFTGVEIDTAFTGRDPLKELIDIAHQKRIKVIAWFEFGFSSSYQQDGGEILKRKPHWSAINNENKLATKNGFEWMNGIHNEVQDFLLSLVMEVVNNYEIDGIQGDDRLPAMPVEAGYDPYTIELYKSEHKGKLPPSDFRDPEWIEWRSEKLTLFMKRLFTSVKKTDPNLIVSISPSIFPFSKDEYLQDWPEWVRSGYVDLIIPQVYRYSFDEYSKELEKIINEQISKEKLPIFYPGMLIKLGDYYPSMKYFKDMILENRKNDIEGEVFFFYEGIKKFPALFKELYREKALFPDLPAKG